LAKRIRQTIEIYNFTTAGHQTASFGVSELKQNYQTLIKQADE